MVILVPGPSPRPTISVYRDQPTRGQNRFESTDTGDFEPEEGSEAAKLKAGIGFTDGMYGSQVNELDYPRIASVTVMHPRTAISDQVPLRP